MTLTEVNFTVRRMAPFAIIVILILLTIYFAIKLLLIVTSLDSQNQTQNSVKKIAINPIFNKIKPLQIPETGTSGNFSYVIDTLDGTTNIENATSAASVFFLQKPAATFGFLDEIYNMAKTAGIDTEVTKHTLVDRLATFDDGKRKIVINIDTFNFSYEYYLDRDDTLFSRDLGTSVNGVQSLGGTFLGKLGKYNQELSQGKRNQIFLRYDKESRQISSLEDSAGSNMVEVDYYRPDIGPYPVVTTTYYNSPHYVIAAMRGTSLDIVKAQIAYFERSKDQVGIYPLRTSDQAFEDLKTGKGLVISSSQPDGEVKIKKVFLAYSVRSPSRGGRSPRRSRLTWLLGRGARPPPAALVSRMRCIISLRAALAAAAMTSRPGGLPRPPHRV